MYTEMRSLLVPDVTAPDGNVLNAGKYVVIWRRQSLTKWKIHRDIFNGDIPPAK